jgi:hypothetical protein
MWLPAHRGGEPHYVVRWKMFKKLFVLSLIVAFCAPAAAERASAASQDDENRLHQALGMLDYTARPEISICFCGSFYLEGEKGFKSYYLVSQEIDLAKYIGKKIFVTGRPFSGICEGTLALPCDFLFVESIVLQSNTATITCDWSIIKMSYR